MRNKYTIFGMILCNNIVYLLTEMQVKKYILFTIFLIGLAKFSIAGPPPPPPPPPSGGGTGPGPACWPPPCIPIDGGISLLIAAGALYGGRKLYKQQKTDNDKSI